jgi:hypothetical protein
MSSFQRQIAKLIGLLIALSVQGPESPGGKVQKITKARSRNVFDKWIAVSFGLCVLLLAPNADALSLKLSDGVTTVTCADGDACDLSAQAGAVTYLGSVGAWFLNVTTGLTYPVIGLPGIPILDLNSVNLSSYNPGTLTISLSETGYIGPLDGTFLLAVGGTTTGTVNFGAYLDSNNGLFGESTSLGYLGAYTGPAFSGTISLPAIINSPSPYSMTLVSNITHTSWGGWTSFDFEGTLPEPATIILLGSGLVVLGLVGRRRKGIQRS